MELTVEGIIKNAVATGIKNLIPLLVNVVLWILTVWIPYLNVGTTIGLFYGITAKMAKGDTIEMTEIFNPVYRKRMGEFFLVMAFVGMGVMFGFYFFIVPAIVISTAWSLAVLLVIDKEMNPMEAISKSNSLTYGKKWTIFLGNLAIMVLMSIAVGIVMAILGMIFGKLGMVGALLLALCYIAAMACFISISMAASAYIYGTLAK